MRKIFIYIITIAMFIPFNSSALSIECDNTIFEYSKNVICSIVNNSNDTLDSITGKMEKTTDLNCDYSLDSFSFNNVSPQQKIISFNCKLEEKLNSNKNIQFTVNNLEYSVNNKKITNEVLKSDLYKINKFEEKKNTDNKPRDTSNSNLLIKNLKIEEVNLVFSKFVTIYDLEVENRIDKLSIAVDLNNINSTYEIIGDDKLEVGDNIVDIYVTDYNGNKLCYTLNVKRLREGEKVYSISSDSTLKKLDIDNDKYKIDFLSEKKEYNLTVGSMTKSLNILTEATNKKSKVEVFNNKNIKNKTVITIKVTSEDGENNTVYKINIKKKLIDEENKYYVIMIVIIIVLLAITILFIITSKKKIGEEDVQIDSSKEQ